MTKEKFTKGPWTACFTTESGVPVNFHITASPHGSCLPILECRWPWKTGKERTEELTANAHLVVAAPELYDHGRIAESALSAAAEVLDKAAVTFDTPALKLVADETRKAAVALFGSLAKARGEVS